MPFDGMGRRARSLFALKSMGMSLLGQGSSGQCRPGLADGLRRGQRRPTGDLRSAQLSGDWHDVGGAAVTTGTHEAEELLLIEEADAWFEYLEATRGQTAVRYREVEPWAWARLTQRLRAIRARRTKLRPAAA
jgi:hypothetical protein